MSARLSPEQLAAAGHFAFRAEEGVCLSAREATELRALLLAVIAGEQSPARLPEDREKARARKAAYRAKVRAESSPAPTSDPVPSVSHPVPAGTARDTRDNGTRSPRPRKPAPTATLPSPAPEPTYGQSSGTDPAPQSGVDVPTGQRDTEQDAARGGVRGGALALDLRSSTSGVTLDEQGHTDPSRGERANGHRVPASPSETPPGVALVAAASVPTVPGTPLGARIGAALEAVGSGTGQRVSAQRRRAMLAELVFAYWQQRLGHPNTLLDAKRQKRIEARLSENGDNAHELLFAIDGALKDDWLMGRDDRASRKYDGIETLFRDRAQVERLAEACGAWKRGDPHPVIAAEMERAAEVA